LKNHPHAIHCLHIDGWHVNHWCYRCRKHWSDTCGQVGCEEYERRADDKLVHQVMLEMEDGTLPIPAEILNLDLSDVGLPRTPPTPSAN
jgi:hypothetical protein